MSNCQNRFERSFLPTQYGIALLMFCIFVQPTFHFFQNGKKAAEIIGADAARLTNTMEKLYKWIPHCSTLQLFACYHVSGNAVILELFFNDSSFQTWSFTYMQFSRILLDSFITKLLLRDSFRTKWCCIYIELYCR